MDQLLAQKVANGSISLHTFTFQLYDLIILKAIIYDLYKQEVQIESIERYALLIASVPEPLYVVLSKLFHLKTIS